MVFWQKQIFCYWYFFPRNSSGRILSLLVSLADMRFNLINAYAPTNVNEGKVFYDELLLEITKLVVERRGMRKVKSLHNILLHSSHHEYFLPSSAIVVRGDFNCYDNPLDKFGSNSFIHKEYDSLRNYFSLVDVWRKLHPNKREFTWFNSSLSLASRLDKFLIS